MKTEPSLYISKNVFKLLFNRWVVVHVQAAYQLLSVQFRTVKGLLDTLKIVSD